MADVLHPDETDDQDELPEQPIDPGDFAAAGQADDAFEAGLLRQACEDAGIPALVQSPRAGLVGKLSAPVDHWSILVPVKDLERARALLTERRAALESDPAGAERAAEEEEAATEGQASGET